MYIRDAFISGIQSHEIRQRLLENLTLTLDNAFEQARSLEMVQKSADAYNVFTLSSNATSCTETVNPEVTSMNLQRCSYCGNN